MKHFIDIENLREEDVDLGNGAIRKANCGAFHIGDQIQISTKIDFSNGSVMYDEEARMLRVFSRKKELDHINTLGGFWNFVQTHPWDMEIWKEQPNWIVFGEWAGNMHTVKYPQEMLKKWYVYDIWDTELNCYLPQSFVKTFCSNQGLEYVEVLYEGVFVSWNHCKSFLHASTKYGDNQEGVVIKKQGDHIFDADNPREPKYLKIVNEEFKETMLKKHTQKIEDPQKLKEKARCKELCESIVTEARVKKEILKMIDESILPSELTPQIMSTIAKTLPKRIYDDCIKEEEEIVLKAGEYAGKIISSLTMQIAKNIIIGG